MALLNFVPILIRSSETLSASFAGGNGGVHGAQSSEGFSGRAVHAWHSGPVRSRPKYRYCEQGKAQKSERPPDAYVVARKAIEKQYYTFFSFCHHSAPYLERQ